MACVNKEKILAWCVHLLTASGIVVGFKALELAFAGRVYEVVFLLLLTVIIDGVDGTLARKFRVLQVLPQIDGHMMDFIVDFINFVLTPTVVFYRLKMAPEPLLFPAVSLILFASLYHYSNKHNLTEDFRFRGFPAWWNLIVYYLYILNIGQWPNFLITLVIVALHFLPVDFIYLSRVQQNRKPAALALLLLIVANVFVLIDYPTVSPVLKLAAVLPLLFLGVLGSIRHELFSRVRQEYGE